MNGAEEIPKDPNAEIVARMEKAHGRVAKVKTPLGMLLFRKPNVDENQVFVDSLSDKTRANKRMGAYKQYVYACVVHPALEEAKRILDEYSSLYTKIGDVLHDMAGADIEVDAGKA